MATWPPLTHQDVTDRISGMGLLAVSAYHPSSFVIYSTTSTTMADIDAPNCVVTFTPPPSGIVLVRFSAAARTTTGGDFYLGVREGTTDVGLSLYANSQTVYLPASQAGLVSGLTPGVPKTWKGAFSVSAGATGNLIVGGVYSPLTLEIWGVL